MSTGRRETNSLLFLALGFLFFGFFCLYCLNCLHFWRLPFGLYRKSWLFFWISVVDSDRFCQGEANSCSVYLSLTITILGPCLASLKWMFPWFRQLWLRAFWQHTGRLALRDGFWMCFTDGTWSVLTNIDDDRYVPHWVPSINDL